MRALIVFFVLATAAYQWINAPVPPTPGTLVSTSYGEWTVVR